MILLEINNRIVEETLLVKFKNALAKWVTFVTNIVKLYHFSVITTVKVSEIHSNRLWFRVKYRQLPYLNTPIHNFFHYSNKKLISASFLIIKSGLVPILIVIQLDVCVLKRICEKDFEFGALDFGREKKPQWWHTLWPRTLHGYGDLHVSYMWIIISRVHTQHPFKWFNSVIYAISAAVQQVKQWNKGDFLKSFYTYTSAFYLRPIKVITTPRDKRFLIFV